MLALPKVARSITTSLMKSEKPRKILLGAAVIFGLSAGVTISDSSEAQPTPALNPTQISQMTQGSMVLHPAAPPTGERVAYHYSHSSHASHYSHQSHYSHYSSRY